MLEDDTPWQWTAQQQFEDRVDWKITLQWSLRSSDLPSHWSINLFRRFSSIIPIVIIIATITPNNSFHQQCLWIVKLFMLITHSCLARFFKVVHVTHHEQVAIDLKNGLMVNRFGTERSFCQLLYTIENHSNGCLSIVHSMVPKFYQRLGLISTYFKICPKKG